jgi:hypothetical protein
VIRKCGRDNFEGVYDIDTAVVTVNLNSLLESGLKLQFLRGDPVAEGSSGRNISDRILIKDNRDRMQRQWLAYE